MSEMIEKFREKEIEKRLLPSIDTRIESLYRNIKWWSRYQDTLEHVKEVILLFAFISIFFDYKIVTGGFIAITGTLDRAIGNSAKKQEILKNELRAQYKELGINDLMPKDKGEKYEPEEEKSEV